MLFFVILWKESWISATVAQHPFTSPYDSIATFMYLAVFMSFSSFINRRMWLLRVAIRRSHFPGLGLAEVIAEDSDSGMLTKTWQWQNKMSYSSSSRRHTQVVEKKWKLRVRFSSTKENRVHQTKISTKTDKDGFSPAVLRSRLNKIFPLLNFLFGAFVFCFL